MSDLKYLHTMITIQFHFKCRWPRTKEYKKTSHSVQPFNKLISLFIPKWINLHVYYISKYQLICKQQLLIITIVRNNTSIDEVKSGRLSERWMTYDIGDVRVVEELVNEGKYPWAMLQTIPL